VGELVAGRYVRRAAEDGWGGLVNLGRTGRYLSFVMKDPAKPDKRRKYDAAFRAEALRLAEQSRSTQAAA